MSSQQRVRRLLRAPALWLVLLGIAPATAEEIRDWPCDAPFAERFDPVQVWGSALPRPLADGWRQDAEVRDVVEFAANPENTPRQGAKRIAKFAAPLGGDRARKRLMLVFAGLLDQFNLLRGFVIEGVRDFVVRAKILREAVDRNEAAVAALPDAGALSSSAAIISRPAPGTRGEWTMLWRRLSFCATATVIWTRSCAN